MKAIITGSIRAAREELLYRQGADVLWWSDARMRGVVDGVETFIFSVDQPHRLQGVELASYEVHPTAIGHRRLREVTALADSRVRLSTPDTKEQGDGS